MSELTPPLRRTVVVGGAGFIGGHVVDRLLADASTEQVTVYDNFSSGREWHLAHHAGDARLAVVRGEVGDLESLATALRDHRTVIHLASNPDIAKAMTDPAVDFHEGTFLTHCVAEAVRRSSVELVVYASGSGVYGDLGAVAAPEQYGPLEPVSTYGASKLAGEALLGSYAHMFGGRVLAFRFANVVGPRQTHGVGFDFVRRLLADPTRLTVLGDGSQSKSYVHVDDVIDGVLHAVRHAPVRPFDVFNLATDDHLTVREIAALAIEVVGLDPDAVEIVYGTEDRGWKGDVPVVRLATDKLRGLGWTCRRSTPEALGASLRSMLVDIRDGRMG